MADVVNFDFGRFLQAPFQMKVFFLLYRALRKLLTILTLHHETRKWTNFHLENVRCSNVFQSPDGSNKDCRNAAWYLFHHLILPSNWLLFYLIKN